jgi:hypothetical protein
MTLLVVTFLVTLLAFQQTAEPPEVKYNVAFIAAVASIIVALISAAYSVFSLRTLRKNQSALQKEQAALTKNNQEELAALEARLTLETQGKLERTKSELSEKSQARLESLKSDLTAKNQEEIELLRSTLGEQGKEKDARRDYEYEARKRLYDQVEPVRFHLHEALEEAHYRVRSLARTSRSGNLGTGKENWLGGYGYYLRSTIYKLFLPVVYFRLLHARMTFTDFNLDRDIALQYGLLKLYVRSFTDDFEFAALKPKLPYDPNHGDWERLAVKDPAAFSRQALVLGDLECIADILITREDGQTRALQFGEFEMLLEAKRDDENLQEVLKLFTGFSPVRKPVLSRLLLVQACFAKLILSTYESVTEPVQLSARLDELVADPELVSALAWSDGKPADLSFVRAYWAPRLDRLDSTERPTQG